MSLKEILQKIINEGQQILLNDNQRNWEAMDLLNCLSEAMLKRQAYFQPGLYISEIDELGFLGRVIYRVKPKTI